MPLTMDELVAAIAPGKTTLLLGAGASVPSGAPTGQELAHHLWRRIGTSEPQSDDLTETATLLSRKYGRRAVVDQIVAKLKPLRPTGGLLGIPKLGWKTIYTTNFDELVEKAFKAAHIPVSVFRSNYDFTNQENNTGVKIYKIHGCISQDGTLGHKASMVLTESDYEQPEQFRQTLFSNLSNSLLTGDVLVIGQSLRDRHLNDLIKDVLAAKPQGAPGQLYVLVYDRDDIRAPLLEDRGARVVFGGLDQLVHAIANGTPAVKEEQAGPTIASLPMAIVSATYDVAIEAGKVPNVIRMFNGGAATYADVRANATFERAMFRGLSDQLTAGLRFLTITGAAGVGKTTFGRQLLSSLLASGVQAWEHSPDFVFQHKPWLQVDAKLRSEGKRGVLLIDECTRFLRQVNQLVDELARTETAALSVILTANSAQWAPRIKTPHIFTDGMVIELSRLKEEELNSLVNLVEFNPVIAGLVHADFKRNTRAQQLASLRQKCSADMFVCLKNIFATESLDVILLQEYDELEDYLQEYYRYVAALQAVGAHVHRQLIIRMLRMPPQQVAAALEGLHGIIDEYDIKPKEGVYGWTTRHLVIARKIADYKFSSIEELRELFETIIDNINPSVSIELQSLRDICDAEHGIGRLGDADVRKRLYRRLIDVAPGERIPWHRLSRDLLQEGDLEGTEYLIRDAEEAVGADAPIDRYKVRLLLVRAQKTPRISEKDRVAILRKAYEQAMTNVGRHKWDKFSYTMLCDVALALVAKGESEYLLSEAIESLRGAADRIQDPDMQRQIRHYEEARTRVR